MFPSAVYYVCAPSADEFLYWTGLRNAASFCYLNLFLNLIGRFTCLHLVYEHTQAHMHTYRHVPS